MPFGGDDDDPSTSGLLQQIAKFLNGQKSDITIDGLYNSPGMWVDSAGNYYVTPDQCSAATKDGTNPVPNK